MSGFAMRAGCGCRWWLPITPTSQVLPHAGGCVFSHPLLRFFRWMHNRADLNLCPSTVTQKQLVAQGCRHVHVWSRDVDNQHTDLAAAYASADLFVFPAANETLGNVVLEAMSSALTQHVARNTGKHKNFAWR